MVFQRGLILSYSVYYGQIKTDKPLFLQQQCQKSTPLFAPHGPFQQLEMDDEMDDGLHCKGTWMSDTSQK